VPFDTRGNLLVTVRIEVKAYKGRDFLFSHALKRKGRRIVKRIVLLMAVAAMMDVMSLVTVGPALAAPRQEGDDRRRPSQ
jgi:hypothetical protein